MRLDAQLRVLVREAEGHGLSPRVMQRAVNPVLVAFAHTLKHRQYHLIQNFRGDWLLTTLARADEPKIEKTVIHAFATEKVALACRASVTAPPPTVIVPVTHLLFQLFALEGVHSIIFLDNPHDRGREIVRSELRAAIQKQLRALPSLPLDIA